MPTPTTHIDPPRPGPTLHVALDLGNTSWCLAGAQAVAAPVRVRMFPASSFARRHAELASARQHFGLPADAPIVLCYEAGRDDFWLQRACTAAGSVALVVDSSSIDVSRRARRANTDRLDATLLLLFCHTAGERARWRVLHVPTVEEEDRRQMHRELARLTQERTRAVNRLKGLLAAHGLRLTSLRALPDQLPHQTQWDHTPLPPGVCQRVQLNWARLAVPRSLIIGGVTAQPNGSVRRSRFRV